MQKEALMDMSRMDDRRISKQMLYGDQKLRLNAMYKNSVKNSSTYGNTAPQDLPHLRPSNKKA